jgi:hypothetical protein
MRKGNDEIVQRTWTGVPQLVNYDPLRKCMGGLHGVGLPVFEVK